MAAPIPRSGKKIVGAALVLSALLLKFAPLPFLWLGLGWAGVLFWLFSQLGQGWARVVAFNLGCILVVAAGVDGFLGYRIPPTPEYSEAYFVADDALGTVPAKNFQARSSRARGSGLLYDATYTIDANGLRIAPPVDPAGASGTVLFFGCSFTFGEGVQDNETLPFQVGVQSQGRLQTYNFGFHGYGPHETLAALETGRVQKIVPAPTRPVYAIFQALPDHVARVAGKVPYHRHAPKYAMDGTGAPRRVGHFDDGQTPPGWLAMRLLGQLRKSGMFLTYQNYRPAITDGDVALFLSILSRSRDLLEEQYPGIEFHVVLWQNFAGEAELYQRLLDGLRQRNLRALPVSDLLPDYASHPENYVLDTADAHPNPKGYSLMAQGILQRLLTPKQ